MPRIEAQGQSDECQTAAVSLLSGPDKLGFWGAGMWSMVLR